MQGFYVGQASACLWPQPPPFWLIQAKPMWFIGSGFTPGVRENFAPLVNLKDTFNAIVYLEGTSPTHLLP